MKKPKRCRPAAELPDEGGAALNMIDQLRAAVDALNDGNPAPFAVLLADDSEWRGLSEGPLWWKQTPACHGPDEARDVLQHQIRKRAAAGAHVRPDFTQVGEDTIIGSSEWMGTDGRRHVRYQVLTLRGDKIVDMQGCRSLREAKRFAHRH
jgi:ketosteroid isomerase-like protein